MRIAMIFHSLNVAGGSVSVFLSLANELQNQGHDIDIYCYYFDAANCFPELNKNLKIHAVKKISLNADSINNASFFNRFKLGLDYYIFARKIFPLLRKKKFDVIYASEACSYIPALMYKKKFNVSVYWSVFDPISLVDNKRPGLITHRYKWFKKLLELHNTVDSRKIKKIDRVIVPTHKMKKQLDTFYQINCLVLPTAGIRKDDINFNNIPVAEKRLKEKFGFKKQNETILFSNGHFLPHRRYEDVLQAISILRKRKHPIKYILSGSSRFDPVYFERLKLLAKELSINDLVLFDDSFKSNREIIGYYQYCDIFLFISVEQTWGLAPFEAMAYRKPVIISSGVGCSEVLENNKTAIVVDQRSPEQVASGIDKLIRDQGLARSLGQNSYNFVIANFTYKSIAKKLVDFFAAN